jgi:translation initiation factor 3 subunit L
MAVQNMVHVVESVINRKYGGWFVRNTEHSQRVFDALRASPLPISKVVAASASATATAAAGSAPEAKPTEPKLKTGPAWGGAGRKVEFAV